MDYDYLHQGWWFTQETLFNRRTIIIYDEEVSVALCDDCPRKILEQLKAQQQLSGTELIEC